MVARSPQLRDNWRWQLCHLKAHYDAYIRARLLADAGADPDDAAEIVIRDDGLCADIGYPWGVQLRDGRILLAYYWTDADGVRHIVGSWLELTG